MGFFNRLKSAAAPSLAPGDASHPGELGLSDKTRALFKAIDRSMAMIEFSPRGEVLWANDNFCRTMGYGLPAIVGRHHRMFCTEDDAKRPDYALLWQQLGAGNFVSGRFRRLNAKGQEIWLEASYNAIVDDGGKVVSVMKVAQDVTTRATEEILAKSTMDAASRSMGIIEFSPDGHVLWANDNFLRMMEVRKEKAIGQHHRLFCDPEYSQSEDYFDFWTRAGVWRVHRWHLRPSNGQRTSDLARGDLQPCL